MYVAAFGKEIRKCLLPLWICLRPLSSSSQDPHYASTKASHTLLVFVFLCVYV